MSGCVCVCLCVSVGFCMPVRVVCTLTYILIFFPVYTNLFVSVLTDFLFLFVCGFCLSVSGSLLKQMTFSHLLLVAFAI